MPNKNIIPAALLEAAVKVLQVAAPDLTADALSAALRDARTGNETRTPEKPLSRKQAADFLGVSVSTVHRMMKRGQLKAVHAGPRIVRIAAASVYAYAGSRKGAVA